MTTMNAKKLYIAPETEVLNLEIESMCNESFALSDNSITDADEVGLERAAKDRLAGDLFDGGLW